MSMTWYVVHTQPSKELLAKQNLESQGYAAYLPRFQKISRHARQFKQVLAPLFPRYLFVGFDADSTSWRSITGTRGVSYLLMSQDTKPAQVPSHVIEHLKSQEIKEGIVPIQSLHAFTQGEKVRILEGVFKDHLAICGAFDDHNRVQLLLSFIGREIKMTLPTYAVEAA